jgi:hypothetical protein
MSAKTPERLPKPIWTMQIACSESEKAEEDRDQATKEHRYTKRNATPQLAISFCLHRGTLMENTGTGQRRFRSRIPIPKEVRKKLYVS